MPAPASPARMFLDAVETAGLLGTGRGGAPTVVPPGGLAGRLGVAGESGEEAFLRMAAAASPWARAGRGAESVGEIPAAAAAEELPVCSPGAAGMLLSVLRTGNRELQGEWVELAWQRRMLAPPDALPGLLDLGRQYLAVRERVRAVIGRRGVWLAAMNSDWQYAAEADDAGVEGLWQTGSREQRLAVLRQCRRESPARAVELLRETWGADSHEDRAAFLAELAHGLSMADEPFLDSCLDDKRKPVRQAAAALLARLPESGYVQRMIGRTRDLLTFTPAKKRGIIKKGAGPGIAATLPAAYDKSWARDGIEEKPPQGMGERAWWLQQMLSVTPPGTWSAMWGEAPAVLLGAAEEGDWRTMLVTAWSSAAIASSDEDWAEAILIWWIDALRGKAQHAVREQELLATLAPARRERLVLEQLRLQERARIGNLIEMMDHRWSAEFSREILELCDRAKPFFSLSFCLARFHHSTAADVVAFLDRTGRLATLDYEGRRYLHHLEFRAQLHREFAS